MELVPIDILSSLKLIAHLYYVDENINNGLPYLKYHYDNKLTNIIY